MVQKEQQHTGCCKAPKHLLKRRAAHMGGILCVGDLDSSCLVRAQPEMCCATRRRSSSTEGGAKPPNIS